MHRQVLSAGLGVMLLVSTGQAQDAGADDAPVLREELMPLAFLAGSCWTGVFPGSETFDVHCYEPVYGGQYLRDVHAVPQGAAVYRGETLYHWDAEAEVITYRYYNSIGGVSDGTMTPVGNRMLFPDETHRGQGGEERVFSTVMEITGPDGYSVVTSEDGEIVMQIEFQRISRQDADEMVPDGVW
ncbi:hypothetical protein Mmar10_1919 [Maricaulis maris MCS10]|uniref:DUF1579 domain-containing protein n=1 Tax=Maricaulis maris (strain MCS10) TaxID=394221 RepID=Q0ANC6_MARMM|nr:hypothetical protein [Maricaulis maris]ABI66211.1 hypothetical protein Mmar10_1919 [Maricaulis maris MCS10]